jgi:hypothetical protein
MAEKKQTSGHLLPQTPGLTDHVQYHRDGSLWAKGQLLDGHQTGYWEWFRKDGPR